MRVGLGCSGFSRAEHLCRDFLQVRVSLMSKLCQHVVNVVSTPLLRVNKFISNGANIPLARQQYLSLQSFAELENISVGWGSGKR